MGREWSVHQGLVSCKPESAWLMHQMQPGGPPAADKCVVQCYELKQNLCNVLLE